MAMAVAAGCSPAAPALRWLMHVLIVVGVAVILVTPTTTVTMVQGQQLPGTWEVLLEDAGIASMHTAVTRFGNVVLLDRTNIGPSRLPAHRCRPAGRGRGEDCTAHSALFDPSTRRIRPLTILTDTWCSSGQFLPDGTLLQTGGDFDGLRKFRAFRPSPSFDDPISDWQELQHPVLADGRWYATNQILPDGSVIIIGGRASPTVEFYPPRKDLQSNARPFPFLANAGDAQMDNLYPYVHLLPDGNLFVFANTRAVLYDYTTGTVIKEYPRLEGGPRNYPSAGSSAMLALVGPDHSTAEVVVCGGASRFGIFIQRDIEAPAGTTCGRITATSPDPSWAVEQMPSGRIMGDMVMLPTGDVLIINGAMSGSQGFDLASDPCLNPVLYRPEQPDGLRFMVLTPTTVPRMYHSTANLLPDGRVLLAGSNPHYIYRFGPHVKYPTELRLEAFSPEYLSPDRANLRPEIESLSVPEAKLGYSQPFDVVVTVELPVVGIIEVNIASAPFSTHSFSMGQRLIKLNVSPATSLTNADGAGPNALRQRYQIGCTAPPSGKVAPPGYYMLFAVNQGIPSVAKWVQIGVV